MPLHSCSFKIYNNLIFLKASLNNSRPLSFLFDTGASGCVISEKIKKELNLHTDSGSAATTGGGDVEATYLKNATISLAPHIKLHNLLIATIDLSGLESGVGEHIDGIIGYEAFEKWGIKIDYQNKIISFFDASKFQYAGRGERIKLQIEDNLPYASVSLKSKNGSEVIAKLMVDIGGASNDIRLNTFITEKHKLTEINSPTLPLTYGAINSGKATGEAGRLQELRIGNIVYAAPLLNFSTTRQGEETDSTYDGIINAPFLRQFTCYFNYSKQEMILEKAVKLLKKVEFDMSGISLISSGSKLNIYTVRQVLAKSPAAEQGIEKGDVVEKINGKAASLYRLSDIRGILSSKVDKIIKLMIWRKGILLEKEIILKKLV
jgi:hypothetical protein